MATMNNNDENPVNPFGIKDILLISFQRKKIVLFSFIAFLVAGFVFKSVKKTIFSTKLNIYSSYIPAYQLKAVLSDIEDVVSGRGKFFSKEESIFQNADFSRIQSVKTNIISYYDKDVYDNNILEIEIQAGSDTVLHLGRELIKKILSENDFITQKAEYEKTKMTMLLQNVKETLSRLDKRKDMIDSFYKNITEYKNEKENALLPDIEAEFMVYSINLKNFETAVQKRVDSFSPFILLNEATVITNANKQSTLKLLMMFGFAGLAAGVFLALCIEYLKR